MINIRPDEITSIIREQIEKYDQDVKVDNIGTVLQVGDGIARVYGLEQAMSGELLEFADKTIGIALNLENDNVGVVLMGSGRQILEGSTVKATGKIAQIPEAQVRFRVPCEHVSADLLRPTCDRAREVVRGTGRTRLSHARCGLSKARSRGPCGGLMRC